MNLTPQFSNPAEEPNLYPGQFPPLPHSVAPLVAVNQAVTAARMTLKFRDITAFNGSAGNGKTTAASMAIDTVQGVEWRYVVPPQRANTKAMMLSIYEAVFGFSGAMTERHATDALVRRLIEGDMGLVVDEVHHVGLLGMQQLRHLWDRCAVFDRSFPLLLVGCDIPETLANAKEVRQRIARWVRFDIIQHPDDLHTLMGHLHPRLAATSPSAIEQINERVTEGSIRGWYQFAKHIDLLPATKKHSDKGLTSEEIRQLRNNLGMR